jgi:hypothetical protein
MFAMIIVLILFLTFDLFKSSSVYLYFSTEIGILFFALAVYFSAFKGVKWSSPSEKVDAIPRSQWKVFSKDLFIGFISLGLVLTAIWIATGLIEHSSIKVWLKKGAWFLYYIGIFTVSVIIIRRHMKYVHARALVTAVIIMVFFLTTYEILLLSHGTGWKYNNTVIGWFIGVPVDNVLFIYPVATALTMIFYSVITRNMNDLKAFWLLNLILLPCCIIVELIGIYPLNLWEIFNQGSIWPMGQTNLEEFLYYILFQFLSIALYVFFQRNFKTPETAACQE